MTSVPHASLSEPCASNKHVIPSHYTGIQTFNVNAATDSPFSQKQIDYILYYGDFFIFSF